MKEYILISAIIFIILSFSWEKNDIVNLIVKVSLFFIGLAGIYFWLNLMGYIIKIQ